MFPVDNDFLTLVSEFELPALKPLGQKQEPGPIPQQTLEVGTSAIDEDEEVTAQWVFLKATAHDFEQPIERLSHIHRLSVDKDSTWAWKSFHSPGPKNRSFTP